MKLNRKGVAECFGCSLPTVDTWVKDGLPVEVEGSRGIEWRFDSVAVHEWLVKQAKAGRRTRGNRFGEGGEQAPEGEIKIEEAKRRHEVAKMKSAELELAEAMGAVAPVAVLSKVISDEIGKARARLLAIPSKFRPTALMHAAKPEKAQKLVDAVDELVRDALAQIKADGGAA